MPWRPNGYFARVRIHEGGSDKLNSLLSCYTVGWLILAKRNTLNIILSENVI